MIEPSLQIGGGNWANKSDSLLGYHKDGANFYADELTFSRNSLGSYTDANGLIQSMPYNLLTYSEEFNNAAWTKSGATISANSTTAPNGTTTADKFTEDTSLSAHSIRQDYSTNAEVYTFSIYVKANGRNWVLLYNTTALYAKTFNLSTVQVGTASVGTSTAEINSIGDGWCRISITGTCTQAANAFRVYTLTSDTVSATYQGNGTDGVYIYGAQLNQGSTALPYFATTTRLNLARVDYKDNVNGSLLLEPQRTNLITYSEQFDNAYWTKDFATITANATISPDGTLNAENFTPTTDNVGNHRVFRTSTASAEIATYSIFIKANGHNYYALRESTTTGASIGFNLATESVTVTYSTGGCTASNGKIEDYGNGWYRISGTFSFASATSQGFGVYAAASTWTSGDVESVTWAGNGTSGAFIWGAQLEASSYPTSYIKSEGAATTRLADSCFKTGISDKIGQSEGTIFCDVIPVVNAPTDILALNLSTSNSVSVAFITNTVTVNIFNSSNFFQISGGTYTKENRYKIAVIYKNNNSKIFVNGILINTNTSNVVFNGALNDLYNYPTNYYEGASSINFNSTQIYKTALSDAECITLTTL